MEYYYYCYYGAALGSVANKPTQIIYFFQTNKLNNNSSNTQNENMYHECNKRKNLCYLVALHIVKRLLHMLQFKNSLFFLNFVLFCRKHQI